MRATLDYEISMKLHPDCGAGSGQVIKLNRATIGLEQTGRQWNHYRVAKLAVNGIERSKMDPCILYWVVGGKLELLLAVYVDGILAEGE